MVLFVWSAWAILGYLDILFIFLILFRGNFIISINNSDLDSFTSFSSVTNPAFRYMSRVLISR